VRRHPPPASAPVPPPIQVLLADDHWVVRAGLRAVLDGQPNLRVVGEAATGEEAVEKTRALKPDVVLLDLLMPGIGGLEALRRIAALQGPTKVLVLSVHLREDTLLEVLEAGGSGFVTKSATAENLTQAIRAVAQNDLFLDPSAARVLVDHQKEPRNTDGKGPLARLSAREREVLALTAEGHSATEIARLLRLSPKTVDTYRARMMDKLGLKHRADLVRFALRAGLLKVE
jgi:two-component system, NarL family, response regulator NreC